MDKFSDKDEVELSDITWLAFVLILSYNRCIESLLETFRSESRANRFYNSDTLYPV